MSKKKKKGLYEDIVRSFGNGRKIGRDTIKTSSKYVGFVTFLSSFLGSKIANPYWRFTAIAAVITLAAVIGYYLLIIIIIVVIAKILISSLS